MAATGLRVSVPLIYIETAIPEGMTIAEYRASRPRPPQRKWSVWSLRRWLRAL